MAESFDARLSTFGDIRDDYDDEFGRKVRPPVPPGRLVRGPAIAFLIIGPLMLIGLLIVEGILFSEWLERPWLSGHLSIFLAGTFGVLLGGVGFIAVIVAGMDMLQLRRRWLALVAAYVVTATALAGVYAVLFFPFGIWALVVLYRPDVREAFDRRPVQSHHDH